MHVGLRDAVIRVAGDSRPHAATYHDHLERIINAEQLGYEFIWFGEHQFMPNPRNPSSLMLLAALSMRISRMRLGTSVLLTPCYNPVRLAEDVAELDLISNGRVDFILGTASIRGEFETFGVQPDERFDRTWEVMALLEQCYVSEEAFDHHGNTVTSKRADDDAAGAEAFSVVVRGYGWPLAGERECRDVREYSPRGRDLAFEHGGHPRCGDAEQEEDTMIGFLELTGREILPSLKTWGRAPVAARAIAV